MVLLCLLHLNSLLSSFATGDKDGHGLKFANSGPIFCFNVGPAKITETLLFEVFPEEICLTLS